MEKANTEPLYKRPNLPKGKRKCSKCQKVKDESEFYRRKDRPKGSAFHPQCLECGKIRSVKYREELRVKIFEMYGSKCVVCGETDLDVLTVDHVNGDGNKERSNWGSPIKFYNQIIKLKRKDLRVLCRNCNWKAYVKREIS